MGKPVPPSLIRGPICAFNRISSQSGRYFPWLSSCPPAQVACPLDCHVPGRGPGKVKLLPASAEETRKALKEIKPSIDCHAAQSPISNSPNSRGHEHPWRLRDEEPNPSSGSAPHAEAANKSASHLLRFADYHRQLIESSLTLVLLTIRAPASPFEARKEPFPREALFL